MDQTLTDLRQRATRTATVFIRAQHAYLEAADLNARKPETELKMAAEEYHKAIGPYDAALSELHQYLLMVEPSETISAELERTERLIEALEKEKTVTAKLIAHHVDLITQKAEPTTHYVKEREE